jgi:hypothetical protein
MSTRRREQSETIGGRNARMRRSWRAATGCSVLAFVVTAFVGSVDAQTPSYAPDVPPKAARITISVPNEVGDVTIIGAPGAVPGSSAVALFTLETGHVAIAQATPDGQFSTSLFAPAGTSVLVKADPTGLVVRNLQQRLVSEVQPFADLMPAVPGTIIRVADPPPVGPAVPFVGASKTNNNGRGSSPLPAYIWRGTISSLAVQPGETVRVQGEMIIDSPALQAAGAMQARNTLTLQRLAGPDGAGTLAQSVLVSTFSTPTGLPFERLPRFFNGGLDRFVAVDLVKTSSTRAVAVLDLSLQVPAMLPHGFYRSLLKTTFVGVPVESPPGRPIVSHNNQRFVFGVYGPIVRIGNPAPPRLYWTLLADTLSNGARGVRALEDQGRFGLSSRTATFAETLVVPRVDPQSGQAITYRLEPFVPVISLGRSDLPNAPLVPFRFPSGGLIARIQRPDGTVQVIGPAAFVQARVKTPARNDGSRLDGGPHPTDVYELSTLDPRFEVQFGQDGRHVITLNGTIEDVWGNVWSGEGTYEVQVARTLALDTAVLPGTPLEAGDTLSAGVVISPAVAADVEVRLRLAPGSRADDMIERVIRGRANRFGYFKPLGGGFTLDQPGEYRIDVTATFRDETGALWMGTRTWGGVVASRDPGIIAHGRRGLEKESAIGLQWFFRSQTQFPTPGQDHVFIPFHAGDITWAHGSDSTFPMVTFQDPSGALTALVRSRAVVSGNYRYPSSPPGTFDERAAVGEVPLVSARPDDVDPHIDPDRVDLWAYSYRSVQRPLIRVREEITEDSIQGVYWSFNNAYMGQIGVGRNGDLPNDVKFQYGAAVLRGPAVGQPRYAIYGSLWVHLPESEPAGNSRTFPPFQGNAGGPSGGPIMILKGRVIDLFVHLTGVRSGAVLEVGDTFAMSGAIGPTLPALVAYTITKPSGQQVALSGRANRVGYYYRPEHDFVVDEPGLWTVDVGVTHDGLTSAGPVTPPFPTGDVLGTASGRIVVYVVPRGSAPLNVPLARDVFLPPPAQLDVAATAPAGLTVNRAHATALMPGFVLESRDLPPGGSFAYRYDPVALARDFPNLDVRFQGQPAAADLITLSLFGSGLQGQAARILNLHGTELLNLPPPTSLSSRIDVTTDRAVYRRSQPLSFALHLIQGTSPEPADIYIGLLHPDGTFDSLLTQASGVALVPTGTTPMVIAQSAVVPFDFSAPVATRPWTPADPPGTYIAFAVRVRPGQLPFDQANWLSVGYVGLTLNP